MGTGIPVPAVIPEGSKAFILCVPDDPFFYGVVMGALKVMTFRYYWQGSPDQIDAVTERMLTMYYDYQEQVGCMICEMIAQCFTDQDPDLMAAVAEALRSNPLLLDAISQGISENGGGTPGKPISEEQAQQDTLPENVRDSEGDCIPDALWGGILYLVQSGNRTIIDFFEVLEAASNVLEASAIMLQNVPAVGGYAASAAQFADKMQEQIAEGYAAAYTEAFEESLACDLFCLARSDCALAIDDILAVVNARLATPLDLGDMGEIMAGIASGTWIGDEIANVAFLVYFSALKFGQQFGDKIGIRPLTQLMSLGADQLASDNWEVLCDCPVDWSHRVVAADEPEFVSFPPLGFPVESVGTIAGDVVSQTSSSGDFVTGTNIRIDLLAENAVSRVLVSQIAGTGAPDGGFVNGFINLLNSSFSVVASATLPQDNGTWQEAVVYGGSDVRYIDVQRVFLGGALTQDWNIDIEGTGSDPFA